MWLSPCHTLLLWPFWCWRTSQGACLEAPADISHVKDPLTGEDRVLKIACGNWDTAHLMSHIAHIILTEGIGLATEIDFSFSGSGETLKSVIGCTTEDCTEVKEHPDTHFDFENWYTGDGERYKKAQPSRFKQTFLGFDGQEGIFFKEEISQTLWSRSRLPLEYYLSWSHPERPWSDLFNRPRDIEIPSDQGCRGSTAETMARSGMPCDSDGWWYSPACRNNTDECVPVLLGGIGWLGMETCAMVQSHNLPFAVTFLDWPDRRIQNGSVSALFYWWRPDWTYKGLGGVTRVIGRRHNRQEWNELIFTTDFPDFMIEKFMWAGVEQMSPVAAAFFDSFTFSTEDMNGLMAQMYDRQHSDDENLKATLACEWVRANEVIWRNWTRTLCEDGKGKEMGETVCRACEPGRYSEAGACRECSAGRFSQQAGSRRCTDCAPGNFSAGRGQTACESCPPGTSTDGQRGLAACIDCPKGKFSAGEKEGCDFCQRGEYANVTGAFKCSKCEGSTTTREIASDDPSQCLCPEGTYKALEASPGHCSTCPEGMRCRFGADAANFPGKDGSEAGLSLKEYPQVLEKHWSSPENPTSVFVCGSKADCPGGAPGTCNGGLVGRACTRCADHYTMTQSLCVSCSSKEVSVVLLAFVPLFLSPLMVICLYMINGRGIEAWDSWRNMFPCIVFIGLDFYQTVDLLQAGNVIIPAVLQPVFPGQSSTERLYSIFRPECIGVQRFEHGFVLKALGPVFVLVIVLYTKFLSYGASRIAKKPSLNMDRNRVFCIFMAAMFTFFNAVAALSLVLFRCVDSPNKRMSLSADLSIICWDSPEWQSMAAVGSLCVLVYCFGFGSVFAKTIIQAPLRDNFADRGYQNRWKFLFHKFRPTVWWWALVYLQKNFLLNLGFVIMVSGVSQLYWAMTVLVLYICWAVICQPHRARSHNILELVCCLSLVCLISLLVWFTEGEDPVHTSAVADMIIVVVALPVVLAFLMVLSSVKKNALPRHEEELLAEKHRAVTRALGCYMDLCQTDPGKGFEFFKTIGEWDRWYMMQSADAVGFELLGERLSKAGRLVDKSSERQKMMGNIFTDI